MRTILDNQRILEEDLINLEVYNIPLSKNAIQFIKFLLDYYEDENGIMKMEMIIKCQQSPE